MRFAKLRNISHLLKKKHTRSNLQLRLLRDVAIWEGPEPFANTSSYN